MTQLIQARDLRPGDVVRIDGEQVTVTEASAIDQWTWLTVTDLRGHEEVRYVTGVLEVVGRGEVYDGESAYRLSGEDVARRLNEAGPWPS